MRFIAIATGDCLLCRAVVVVPSRHFSAQIYRFRIFKAQQTRQTNTHTGTALTGRDAVRCDAGRLAELDAI